MTVSLVNYAVHKALEHIEINPDCRIDAPGCELLQELYSERQELVVPDVFVGFRIPFLPATVVFYASGQEERQFDIELE